MRRSLLILAAALLGAALLFALRHRPARRPAAEYPLSLYGLPGVASVEGEPAPDSGRTVLHLRDWHLAPHDLFVKDVKAQAGRELTADEVDRAYADLLDAVEAIHMEIEAVLRDLCRRYGRLPVYFEGLTDYGVNVFKLKATALSDVGAGQIPEARRSLAEARKLKGPEAAELAKQCEAPIARHRVESLELGAVLGPCADGLIEVRAGGRRRLARGRAALAGRRAVRPRRRQGETGRDGPAAGEGEGAARGRAAGRRARPERGAGEACLAGAVRVADDVRVQAGVGRKVVGA